MNVGGEEDTLRCPHYDRSPGGSPKPTDDTPHKRSHITPLHQASPTPHSPRSVPIYPSSKMSIRSVMSSKAVASSTGMFRTSLTNLTIVLFTFYPPSSTYPFNLPASFSSLLSLAYSTYLTITRPRKNLQQDNPHIRSNRRDPRWCPSLLRHRPSSPHHNLKP